MTGGSKDNTMHGGITEVNRKSGFEIDDNALTTSTGSFLKESKFPFKTIFQSLEGPANFRTPSVFPPCAPLQPDRFMAVLCTQVLNTLTISSLSRRKRLRQYLRPTGTCSATHPYEIFLLLLKYLLTRRSGPPNFVTNILTLSQWKYKLYSIQFHCVFRYS